MDWSNASSTGLAGFVTADEAVRIERKRRAIRMAAIVGVGVWGLAAVVIGHLVLGSPWGGIVWVIGTAVVISTGLRHDRELKQRLASSSVVDEHARIVGSAKSVADQRFERQAGAGIAGFVVWHLTHVVVRLVAGDAALPGWVAVIPLVTGIGIYLLILRRRTAAD